MFIGNHLKVFEKFKHPPLKVAREQSGPEWMKCLEEIFQLVQNLYAAVWT